MINLRTLGKKYNLTMKQLGKISSVGEITVSMWESGSREPDYKILVRLVGYFNVSTDYLLGNTDGPTPPKSKQQPLDTDSDWMCSSILELLR